jgi:hypothetical protein
VQPKYDDRITLETELGSKNPKSKKKRDKRRKERKKEKRPGRQNAKTYNSGYSLVVTDPTTNPPI